MRRKLRTAMANRRSTGVVLIVALLAWSVNQRVMACPGLLSRAAVVAPAGSPPAPKPEPSASRHNCCPLEKKHLKAAQPSSHSECKMHEKMDLSCCSIAGHLSLRQPFQKVSSAQWNVVLVATVSLDTLAPALPINSPDSSEQFPFESPGNLQTSCGPEAHSSIHRTPWNSAWDASPRIQTIPKI